MTPGRVYLSVADARDLAEGALRAIGFDHDEARIIADHVIDAALCGYEYSGLAKILNIVDSEHFKLPRRPMKVLRESGCMRTPKTVRLTSFNWRRSLRPIQIESGFSPN